jgi:hypothetical protein
MRPPEAVQGTLEAVGILPQSRESGLRRLRLRHTIVTIHKTNELQSPHLPRSQLPVPWRTRRSTGAIYISCVYIPVFLDPSKRHINTLTICLCLVVATPKHHRPPNLHAYIMENSNTGRQPSIATERNANVLYSNSSPTTVEGSWLERKLRPKKVSARYPIKGKALLFATCGFGSLGDALFGYNSGKQIPTCVSSIAHG